MTLCGRYLFPWRRYSARARGYLATVIVFQLFAFDVLIILKRGCHRYSFAPMHKCADVWFEHGIFNHCWMRCLMKLSPPSLLQSSTLSWRVCVNKFESKLNCSCLCWTTLKETIATQSWHLHLSVCCASCHKPKAIYSPSGVRLDVLVHWFRRWEWVKFCPSQ